MMDNLEKQSEELLVLQSIFEDDKLVIDQNTTPTRGRFLAAVRLPQPFFVVQKAKTQTSDYDACNNEANCINRMEVEHLPPLNLFFELLESYPSESPPAFLLSSNWLTLSQISLLCKKLDDMYKDGDREVILYQWMEFLSSEEMLIYLGITNTLDISKLSGYKRWKSASKGKAEISTCDSSPDVSLTAGTSQSIRKCSNVERISDRSKYNALSFEEHSSQMVLMRNKNENQISLKPCISGGFGPIDLRAMLDLTDGRLLFSSLGEYDKLKKDDAFNKRWFTCKVCFKEKQGCMFTRFRECDHLYCKDCMKSYFEIQIKDGNVCSLNCPEDKCTSQAHPNQVRELVDMHLFSKYDELLLSRSLDTMADIAYCPRKFCQSPLIAEPGTNMGVCPQCSFVFCMFCRMAFHGVQPCNFKSEEKREICNKYLQSKDAEKELMEKRYGRKVLQFLVDNTLSEDWVDSNSKKCPQCNACIEKSDGCNKMTCFRCGTYFCWLCTTRLKPVNPYAHFRDPNSYCYNKLFPALGEGYDEDDGFFPGEFL